MRSQKKLADYWQSEASRCQQVYSQLKELDYYFSVRRYAARYNDKFILAGWLPHREEKALRAALDKVERLVGIVGADDDHIVPAERLLGRRVRAEQVRRFFHIVHDELLVFFHMLGKAQVGVDGDVRQT